MSIEGREAGHDMPTTARERRIQELEREFDSDPMNQDWRASPIRTAAENRQLALQAFIRKRLATEGLDLASKGTDEGDPPSGRGESTRPDSSTSEVPSEGKGDWAEAPTGAKREKLNDIPYDQVPFFEIAEAYKRVAEHGVEKYGTWNWSQGLPRRQVLSSLLRHTWAYLRGEDKDPGSGLCHGDHIIWNAATLVHHIHWDIMDDRRPEPLRGYKQTPIIDKDKFG